MWYIHPGRQILDGPSIQRFNKSSRQNSVNLEDVFFCATISSKKTPHLHKQNLYGTSIQNSINLLDKRTLAIWRRYPFRLSYRRCGVDWG